MSKFQIVILALLTLIACAIFAGAGLIWYQLPPQSQTAAQITALPPSPTMAPIPSQTPTPFELPTAAGQGEATPTNTPVVSVTPTPTEGASLGQQMAGHRATPRAKETEVKVEAEAGVSNVRFWADSTNLQAGACTVLHWQTAGVAAYWIDGQPGAGPAGSTQVCPKKTETHILKYNENVGGLLRSHEIAVTIAVVGGESGGGESGGGSSGGGSGRGQVIAEFDTGNGVTGMKGATEPYAAGVTIYDNGDVLVTWAGCGSGGEWTKLTGDKIEFQQGDQSQGPYFFISATWDKNSDSIVGETKMLSVDGASRYVCLIDDAFIMR